ncbi:MAG TPA: heavy metal-associated domain-containing protein, partial [Planctomycetota bacterium]|nr:heavy metal-associated domain-containing protein [Planctomycetota bacterium]
MREDFEIQGMHCQGCAAKIRQALEDLPGVSRAEVTLEPPRARLDLKAPVALSELDAALRRVGGYSIVRARAFDPPAGFDDGGIERSSAATTAATNE